MDDSPARFTMRGVRKSFGSTVALDGVDLSVKAGEVCALVGQNGAGKSTLMSVLSGALQPDAGAMELDGAPYGPRSPLDARRAGVAMIYQSLSLAPHLSVMENIALGLEPVRWGMVRRAEMRQAARAVLDRLGHPDIEPETLVGRLPPAGQQLVEIARALASGCRVLVFDEPTSSLAHDDVERLFALIARLKADGHAVVYISHFIEEVKQVSDRFVVLRDGRNAGEGVTAEADGHDIVSLMVGREVGDLYTRHRQPPGEPVLTLRDFGPARVSLTLHRGEIVGIAGLLGAGRTELLRAVFGLDRVQGGDIRIAGREGWAAPPERWASGVGMVSEDRAAEGLAMGLSVADNITLSQLDGLGSGPFVVPARQDGVARRWIKALGIKCQGPRQPVGGLSGGNQQKAAVARLLHHDVDVLLLDEPTRGIDVASKAQMYGLIDAVVRNEGGQPRAVLMVSSYFPELLGLCDRIAVMSRGTLGPARPASEWTEHALLMAASGTTSTRMVS